MRADADAIERSGGIGRDDTSALCAQSTCMALVGDNTGDAFSALIAFPLMIAVRPQYSWSEGGINPLGNGIDRRPLHPLGLPFEGIAGQGGIHWRHGRAIPTYRATPSCYRHTSQESGVMLT